MATSSVSSILHPWPWRGFLTIQSTDSVHGLLPVHIQEKTNVVSKLETGRGGRAAPVTNVCINPRFVLPTLEPLPTTPPLFSPSPWFFSILSPPPPSFHTPLWPSVLSQEQKHSRHIWHRSVSQSVMTDQHSYVHLLRIHTSSIHFSRTRKRTKHKSMNNEGGHLGGGDMNMCTMHTMHTVYTMDTIRVSMVNCFVFFCCPIPC